MYLFRHHATRVLTLALTLAAAVAPVSASGVPLASVRQQADVARTRIGAMEQELASAMVEHDKVASSLALTRAEIAANRAKLKEFDASVLLGQRRLSAEVVFLYRTDGNGFAEALLSAPSIEDFASRLLALSRIANRDAEIIGRIKRDRVEARGLAVALAEREAKQATLLSEVAARRAKAQSAIASQQRYADSLSAQVSAALQASTTHGDPKTPLKASVRSPSNPSSLAWATVEGRSGRYAVLANQPKSYSPSGLTFTGLATWYGNVRPNMMTASGRPFDENEFTCAHKTLPFGTRVAVTYRGRRVIVTVTDRGPYGRGRVIDLTRRAASVIGLRSAGVGAVRCEVVRAN